MPTHEFRQRVEQRLEELYQRHLSLHDDQIVSYYKSGSATSNRRSQKPSRSGLLSASRPRMARSTTLATMTGHLPSSPSLRCSSTAWLWKPTDATTFWRESGWSRVATRSTPSSSTSGTTVHTILWLTRGRS